MIIVWLTNKLRRCISNTNKYINIVKTMYGSDEPQPYPERNSPTRLSMSGHASYKGRSCTVRDNIHLLYPPTTNSLSTSSNISLQHTITFNEMAKIRIGKTCEKGRSKRNVPPEKKKHILKIQALNRGQLERSQSLLTDPPTYKPF